MQVVTPAVLLTNQTDFKDLIDSTLSDGWRKDLFSSFS